ncbi:MAG: hypothetical protein II266_06940 [Clostridia bacterium]|nr:hypothetical protein [Clostridia bacterium]
MDENALTIDTCRLSYDNKEFTPSMHVMAVSDKLLRGKRNGSIYLKYTFEMRAKPEKIRIEAEKMHAAAAWLNGESIEFDKTGTQDLSFVSCDIAEKIKLGTNEVVFLIDYYQPEHVYKVFNGVYYDFDGTTESLMNCLSYETDIEAIYLRGDFCVEAMGDYENGEKNTLITDGGFRVTLPRKFVTLDSVAKDGFPFFSGAIKVKTLIKANGNEKYLRLAGRYHTAKVSVNGSAEKMLMFDDTMNVEGLLKKGDNEIVITLTNSCRNLYGPFHNPKDPESYAVSPDSFSLYGSWDDGKSPRYHSAYAFTKFGIEYLELI